MCITTLRKLALPLLIVLILFPFGSAAPQANSQESLAEYILYLPLLMTPTSGVEIIDVWMGNGDGIALSTFLPGAPLEYIVIGENYLDKTATVELSWSQTGPCGSGAVITETRELDPGLWADVTPALAPDCIGVYTATVQIKRGNNTATKSINFRVDKASLVVSEEHGFDRCNMPSIAEMQTWWDSSPYYVANVYLGGISYENTTGCSNDNIDINWMQSVADQGWTYLLAWVGPQAPCSGYKYKMSYGNSYQEGRDEAEMAIQAAADIGLASSIIIHYDVEGYGNTGNTACRNAVDAFLLGWTKRLHELGAKSGAYGSPCNSHVSDWADNDPPPDDIWIAHWIYQDYNPIASVWDVTCLSNDLWTDHQRARQYAGDHTETWGGLSLRIDSNVHDGKVVSLAVTDTMTTNLDATLSQPLLSPQKFDTPQLRDLGLLSSNQGWVLFDNRLLITPDGGAHWDDITPEGTIQILDILFLDALNGLMVHRNAHGINLLSTLDAGISWQTVSISLLNEEIAAAFLDFTDAKTGKLTLKLSTGSSFNQVREFTTQDSGLTWLDGETLSMPVDESMPRLIPGDGNLPDGVVLLDWYGDKTAWALAQQGTCQGTKSPAGSITLPGVLNWQCSQQTQLWMTIDGGLTWQEITPKS